MIGHYQSPRPASVRGGRALSPYRQHPLWPVWTTECHYLGLSVDSPFPARLPLPSWEAMLDGRMGRMAGAGSYKKAEGIRAYHAMC